MVMGTAVRHILQLVETQVNHVPTESSSSNVTMWISILALAVTCIILIVERIEYRLSGPLPVVDITYRLNYADGHSRPLGPNTVLRRDSVYDAGEPGRQGWVVAVEVRNRGRSPTSIISLFLDIDGSPRYQPALPHNPRLPVYLRPGEMHVFLVETVGLLPEPGGPEKEVAACITVIKRRRDEEVCSQPLKVVSPMPPLPP